MEFRAHPNNRQHQQDNFSHQQEPNHQNHENVHPIQGGEREQREYFSIKSHGNKAAIEVAIDETKDRWHTIRIEGAMRLNNQSKKFNWNDKVSIQVTKAELPIVIATLLGLLPACEFRNHGGDAGKWFYIENQKKNFFFKIGQNSTKVMMACPVPSAEALLMGQAALVQHCKNFKGLSCEAGLSSIKTMASHLLSAGMHQPQSKGSQ